VRGVAASAGINASVARTDGPPSTRANNGLPTAVSVPIDIPRIVTVRRAQDAARHCCGPTDDTGSHYARRVNDAAGYCVRSVSVVVRRIVVVHSDRIAIAVDGAPDNGDVVSGRLAVHANVAMMGPGRGGRGRKT
jgi:hypothetical protein